MSEQNETLWRQGGCFNFPENEGPSCKCHCETLCRFTGFIPAVIHKEELTKEFIRSSKDFNFVASSMCSCNEGYRYEFTIKDGNIEYKEVKPNSQFLPKSPLPHHKI